MKPLKILITAPNLVTGGAESQVILLMNGLIQRGFEVSLFLFEEKGEFLDNIPINVKLFTPSTNSPRNILKFLWKIKEIIKVIRDEKPDVVYCRLWPSKSATAFAGWITRTKVVFTEACNLSQKMYFERNGLVTFYERKFACQLSKVIIGISEGVSSDIRQLFNLNSKVRTIYNGCDIESIKKQSRYSIDHPWFDKNEPVLVTVSRLVYQKGHEHLLRCIVKVNQSIPVKLLLIGDGTVKKDLIDLTKELMIEDRVDFIGNKKNPFVYMARCDLFVLPSLYEGFGNVLIEAMSLGLPIISTGCPSGPSEIIENEKNGILVPVADSTALANAIIRILSDKVLNARLRIEAKKRAYHFSSEKMVSEYANLFENISN